VETVKSRIARLGIGAKAKATVKLKNGTKVKGYVAQAGEDDFVIRNRKTDAPTTISYADVLKVDDNKGHSTARNVAIGVAVGVGATILAIFAIVASLDWLAIGDWQSPMLLIAMLGHLSPAVGILVAILNAVFSDDAAE